MNAAVKGRKVTRPRGRPASGLERVKFYVRVDPVDAERFRAVRAAYVQAERRRVTDAEVFRMAVAALVGSLPAELRAVVTRSGN